MLSDDLERSSAKGDKASQEKIQKLEEQVQRKDEIIQVSLTSNIFSFFFNDDPVNGQT
jgi:hypothetical protein